MNAPVASYEVTGIVLRAAAKLGISLPEVRINSEVRRARLTHEAAEAMFEFIAGYAMLLEGFIGDRLTGGIHEPEDIADLVRLFPEDLRASLLRELIVQFGFIR